MKRYTGRATYSRMPFVRTAGLERPLETILFLQRGKLRPRPRSKFVTQLGLEPSFLVCQTMNGQYLLRVENMPRDQPCGASVLIIPRLQMSNLRPR